ncbi:COP23 domain-containing protein [Chamaesiphon sp. VAR_69_metabat_338]|uniref:COP23 domain-containing protein n=1 Tax=Chamaesiphon sp. VAR_69_metabat_338 TaxID=2964704 RepID=UPI00286E087C|nr:COP23 domain-containing protein [Chamaesiphon sp. VAR_69_metabat_338]
MKLLKIATLVTIVTMAGSSSFFAESSQALTATTNFVCGKADGIPATVARTKKGDIPIVIWRSEDLSESGFTPQVRCRQVSARFQSMYRSGQLKYITAGVLNNLPVICATTKVNTDCSSQNLLYTLKSNSDPQQVIKRLSAIRNRSTNRSLEESASLPSTTTIELDWLNEEN